MLQSRLYQLEVTRQAQASAQHTQALSDISWGNQIRSYVLQVRKVTPKCSEQFLQISMYASVGWVSKNVQHSLLYFSQPLESR
jgi:protein subunit release factor B